MGFYLIFCLVLCSTSFVTRGRRRALAGHQRRTSKPARGPISRIGPLRGGGAIALPATPVARPTAAPPSRERPPRDSNERQQLGLVVLSPSVHHILLCVCVCFFFCLCKKRFPAFTSVHRACSLIIQLVPCQHQQLQPQQQHNHPDPTFSLAFQPAPRWRAIEETVIKRSSGRRATLWPANC